MDDRVKRALDPGYRQEQEARERELRARARSQTAAKLRLQAKNLKFQIDRLLPESGPEDLQSILQFLLESRGQCPTCGTDLRTNSVSSFAGTHQNSEEGVYGEGGDDLGAGQ